MRFTAEGSAGSCHYTGLILANQAAQERVCQMCVSVHIFQNAFGPLFPDRRVAQKNKPDVAKANYGLHHLEKAGLSKPHTLGEHAEKLCGSPSVLPVL